MLQNTRATAFTTSELLRENQQWELKLHIPPKPDYFEMLELVRFKFEWD